MAGGGDGRDIFNEKPLATDAALGKEEKKVVGVFILT
jgi:hypothetical protein